MVATANRLVVPRSGRMELREGKAIDRCCYCTSVCENEAGATTATKKETHAGERSAREEEEATGIPSVHLGILWSSARWWQLAATASWAEGGNYSGERTFALKRRTNKAAALPAAQRRILSNLARWGEGGGDISTSNLSAPVTYIGREIGLKAFLFAARFEQKSNAAGRF